MTELTAATFGAIRAAIENSPHIERLLKTLCREIGPRPAGSKAIAQARDLLAAEWRGFGAADVHPESVPLSAWSEGACSLEVIAPEPRRYDCVQSVNSASGAVEGRLVDGGRLTLADLLRLGNRLPNAVVLVKGFDFTGGTFEPLQKRISLAQAAGAVAVLLIGSHPDLPAIFFLSRAGIPVLNISGQSGQQLTTLCANQEVRVKLQASGRPCSATCANLIGELRPANDQGDIIATCAHLDGFFNSPGAIDDLTGIVTITEIARALAPYRDRFQRTLRMIAFTGEEVGFVGSRQYVAAHAGELDRHRFLFSLDCLFENTAKGIAVIGSPEMRDVIVREFGPAHPEVDVRNFFAMSSDYLPFLLQGVPAGRPADWHNTFPAWTHTIADTDENVPLEWIRSNAIVYAHLLLALLAHPGNLPVSRHNPEQVAALIAQADAEESLRWQIGLP